VLGDRKAFRVAANWWDTSFIDTPAPGYPLIKPKSGGYKVLCGMGLIHMGSTSSYATYVVDTLLFPADGMTYFFPQVTMMNASPPTTQCILSIRSATPATTVPLLSGKFTVIANREPPTPGSAVTIPFVWTVHY